MRLPSQPNPIPVPIFKPGPAKIIGAALFRRWGWCLYIGLMLPWLLGSSNPAWVGLAGGLLVIALPFLILRGFARFVSDYHRFVRRL